MGSSIYLGNTLVYDQDIDEKLDAILIDLQQLMQEKKLIMPPADDDEGL